MAAEKKLQVRNLRISFRTNNGKVQAVRDISFDLYKGETLAIVGESGSGKSVTSKAILGIEAGNAIHEGGEILYDGQDLLRITEEDFYRLRGDKVAMIFQDPLSSLNPIMRIGKQLTEAMLLKGKARQRSCREAFDAKLRLLEKCMVESDPANAEGIKAACAEFKKIEASHTKLEQAYVTAHDAAQVAFEKVSDLISRIENKAYDNLREDFKTAAEQAAESRNEFVVPAPAFSAFTAHLKAASAALKDGEKQGWDNALAELKCLKLTLEEALQKKSPDFFALGYAESHGMQVDRGDIEKMNAVCRKAAVEGFEERFTAMAEKGLSCDENRYRALREQALKALAAAHQDIAASETLQEKALTRTAEAVCAAVDASVNPIDIIKDSAACTFTVGLKDFVNRYIYGLHTNAARQRKHDRQQAKFDALAARGKKPDWKVPAANVVDLPQTRDNMLRHIDYMTAHYNEKNAAAYDAHEAALKLIAYLQENASGMVHRVTKHMAKQHALKLMEEVGIPEPRKRYRAYPFEFSGGMRQRIVIAIALAANPDILICDEPTTALDVTIQAQILELINRLKKERELSIIFITHDLGVVANMADRIAVMYAGKIVEYGKSEEIFYSPAHPYTWALLSSMPDLDTKEKLEAIPGTPPDMLYPPVGDAFADRNKYAMEIDFEQQPPQFNITDTHWAATWLLHPNAPKVPVPAIVTERVARMKERNEAAAAARAASNEGGADK